MRRISRWSQGFQPGLDLRAALFQKGWQGEALAECLHRLVDIETGTIGRDFDEDAVRLAEIQRAEVMAVDRPARGQPKRGEALGPGLVLRAIGRAEGDMVDAARPLARRRQIGRASCRERV